MYYIPQEHIYGTKYENGSWSGMVGEVSGKRADIGLNLFLFSTNRTAVVDFFPPIFNTK
jgi:ABC-type amino acid transport substrate-binding protein